MRITWVTRSFLDYRISVYEALDHLCGHNLTVIYNAEVVPERCKAKLEYILGERAVGLTGEIRIGKRTQLGFSNKGIRIPLQRGLLRCIRDSRPDILVSDGFFQWTYAPLLLKMTGSKSKHIMCYERTAHTERFAAKWRKIYRRIVSRWIDGIDCNGSLCAEYVENSLKIHKPLAFGHMAADTSGMAKHASEVTEKEIAAIREKYGLKGLTFLYVGRLIPLKGLMHLLRAWEEAGLKDASLMLVGDGEQKEEILEFIKVNHLINVCVVGAVDYDSLGPYYRVADCFIIPTLEDNWSLVVPEAMASGLPIACSIYNGCHPELVKPENGWTFDPLDRQHMVAVLRSISENRADLPEMGEASTRIVDNYTPDEAAGNLYRLSKQLMQ